MTYEEKLAARHARSEDPTKIPLHIDPREQRMSGHAMHGHTPFDVPFISHIEGNLWQGGCKDGLVLPVEIEHVISLYQWEQYVIPHEPKSILVVKMYDSTKQGYEQVDAIAQWVADCTTDGPTLVHCQAGLNRSSLIASRALMIMGWTADEAISVIRANRSPACLCNPAFEEWLRAR